MLVGNELKRREVIYDEGLALGLLDRVRSVFTTEFFHSRQNVTGDLSHVPVFIIGMPRSGTSLVEQFLASHPLVFGAGEILEFEEAWADIWLNLESSEIFPEVVPTMTAAHYSLLGARYVAGLRRLAPSAGCPALC